MLKDIARTCRSYRRFDQAVQIPEEMLMDWVDTARCTASSCNNQPLRYKIISTPEACAEIFPHTAWAGALPDWAGPEEGERPTAYIVLIANTADSVNDIFTARDEGIAAQTIMLAATEAGFGGCMIGSFGKASVTKICGVDGENLRVDLILALGKPVEQVVLVEPDEEHGLHYYRDDQQVHYVPKRPLDSILL